MEVGQRRRKRTALIGRSGGLSYGDMLDRVAGLCEVLGTVRPDRPIVVRTRSAEKWLISYIALLCSHIPALLVDPSWDDTRLFRAAWQVGARSVLGTLGQEEDEDDDGGPLIALPAKPEKHATTSPTTALARTSVNGTGGTAVIFPTAGTTGDPKLVSHSHAGIIMGYRMLQGGLRGLLQRAVRDRRDLLMMAARKPGGIWDAARGRKRWMTTLPLFRVGGHALLMQALLSGETLVMGDQLTTQEILSAMTQYRVNILSTVPVQAEFLARSRAEVGGAVSRLLVIGLGADKPASDLPKRLVERFGARVVVGYGATEFGGGILATSSYGGIPCGEGEVGRPLPGIKVRVVDETGSEVPPGVIGRLQCMLPAEIQGWTIGDLDKQVVCDGAGSLGMVWTNTHDRARMDTRGRVFVLGRVDDVINRGSVKIDPRECEELLERHPEVVRAGVVGISQERGITKVLGYCQMVPNCSATLMELRDFYRQHARAGHEIDRIVTIDAVPSTLDGKVHRQLLRERAERLAT